MVPFEVQFPIRVVPVMEPTAMPMGLAHADPTETTINNVAQKKYGTRDLLIEA